MIRNYLKTALRSLWKTRSYSLLNIFGLAIGIAASAFIFLWIEQELSYDQLPEKENIYVVKSKQPSGQGSKVFDAVSGLLAPAIKEDIPGIKYAARANWNSSLLLSYDDNSIDQSGHIVDPEFMDIFSLNFLEGTRENAMLGPDNIVLTQSAAKRIFGNEPALGKTVLTNNEQNYTVSAIVQDLPENSSIQFDWLIPFEQFEKDNAGWIQSWDNSVLLSYVRLEPSADPALVNKQLYDLVKRKSGDETQTIRNFLYPMERWRLYNSFDAEGNEQDGRMKYVRLFGIIGGIILLIACINFMNLATARSEKRAKEVGMRKVSGATKTSLIAQFLGESFVLSAIAVTLAALLVFCFTGLFNRTMDTNLIFSLSNPNHLLYLASIVLTCGLCAGLYPAFYLSSFNPVITLKSAKQKAGSAGFIRRGLVVLQYTASLTLIICTAVIFLQIRHGKDRDLGFDISQVITVPLRGTAATKIDLLRDQLLATGQVESIGLSSGAVLNVGVRTGMDWSGKDPSLNTDLYYLWADAGLIPAMGMELTDGRNFKADLIPDSNSIIINESFAKLIKADGLAAGQTVYWEGEAHTVVGVIKDFVYNNVYNPIQPVFFRTFNQSAGTLNIRTKSCIDLNQALQQIEQIIKKNNPAFPFEYQFMDEVFAEKFRSETLMQHLSGTFAGLSTIISCLGLFGLAAFSAERRNREIGIRKVLGATVSSLIGLMNREFIILVLSACLISFPLAWLIMSNWLENYQYKTNIPWWIFGLAGSGALIIALLTVSLQAAKAALTNPVTSLKDE